MNYLILVNIALVLFYLLYRYGLKRLTFFRWNRAYLLLALVLSVLMPLGLFIDYETPEVLTIRLPELYIGQAEPHTVAQTLQIKSSSWSWKNLLMVGYWLGFGLAAVRWILSYGQLRKRMANPKASDSFTFFGKIIMGHQVKGQEMLLEHEEIHVQEKHAYDLLLMDLTCLFHWFNPVCYLFRREMKLLHECLVDQHFEQQKVAYAELLLSYALRSEPSTLVYGFSNQSLLKERITMLFKQKTKRNKLFSYLGIFPIMIISMLLMINCKGITEKKTADTPEVLETEKPQEIQETPTTSSEPETVITEVLAKEPKEQIKWPEPGQGKAAKTEIKEEVIRFPPPKAEQKIEEDAAGQLTDQKVYDFNSVEVQATFPGGINVFRNKVQESILLSQSVIEAGIKGKTEIEFTIGSDNTVKDFKVVQSLNPDLDQAIIKAIEQTKGWQAAIHNGKKVAVRYTLPIRVDFSQQ